MNVKQKRNNVSLATSIIDVSELKEQASEAIVLIELPEHNIKGITVVSPPHLLSQFGSDQYTR